MRKTLDLLLPLLLVSAPCAAQNIDYSYIDGVIVNQEDGGGEDYTGFGLRGSYPLSPQFYAAAEFLSTNSDGGVIDIDRIDMSFGGGYHLPLNRTTDFFAQLDFLRVDTDEGDDDGLRVAAGVRSLVAKQVELRGSVEYVDVFNGELVIDLGVQYAISDAWAGFLELSEGDMFGGYMLGVRFNY